MKTRVGVIFGGRSGEHEISIRSAKTVIEQIDHEKYDVVPIAITNDGRWLSPADSLRHVSRSDAGGVSRTFWRTERRRWRRDASVGCRVDPFSTADGHGRLTSMCFPVLHGTYGEDGTIQGLFEMADLPYVGCGVLASSSCGMDKAFMKTLFRDAGLPICDYVWFLRDEWERHRDVTLAQVESKLGFPVFCKAGESRLVGRRFKGRR